MKTTIPCLVFLVGAFSVIFCFSPNATALFRDYPLLKLIPFSWYADIIAFAIMSKHQSSQDSTWLPGPHCGAPAILRETRGIVFAKCSDILKCSNASDYHALPLNEWNKCSSIPRAQIEALEAEFNDMAREIDEIATDEYSNGEASAFSECASRLSALLHPELKGEDK